MKSVARMLLSRTKPVIWYRGEAYANQGKVKILKYDDKLVKANVVGTEEYKVLIKLVSRGVRRECNCPYSKGICKHLVATAIVWDELRGIERPKRKKIEENAKAFKPDIGATIGELFAKPLKANLNTIRLMVDLVSFPSKRRSRHAILPHCPKISKTVDLPLKMKEIQKAFEEMEKWSQRATYDHYFCAGEMAAAFCELLDVIASRALSSSPEDLIEIMARCVEWYYETFQSIVDGSDGVWIFPVARIGRNVHLLRKRFPSHDKWEEFGDIVCDAARDWETGEVDSDFIASWKDSSL